MGQERGEDSLLREPLWSVALASSPFSFQGTGRRSQGARGSRAGNGRALPAEPGGAAPPSPAPPATDTLRFGPGAPTQGQRSAREHRRRGAGGAAPPPRYGLIPAPSPDKAFFFLVNKKKNITNTRACIIKKPLFLTGKDSQGVKPAEDGSSTAAPASCRCRRLPGLCPRPFQSPVCLK